MQFETIGRNFQNEKGKQMDMSTNAMLLANSPTNNLPDEHQAKQSRAFQPELIDRLFDRFALMYGNKFIDLWRGMDIADVKKGWSDELRSFSIEQVGIAVDRLKVKGDGFPPSLPEFLNLCEAARKEKPRREPYAALPNRATESHQSDEWKEAKARFIATCKAAQPHKPGNEWANQILMRASLGEKLPADSMRMAMEAMQ